VATLPHAITVRALGSIGSALRARYVTPIGNRWERPLPIPPVGGCARGMSRSSKIVGDVSDIRSR
jgi:hypothetical protein